MAASSAVSIIASAVLITRSIRPSSFKAEFQNLVVTERMMIASWLFNRGDPIP